MVLPDNLDDSPRSVLENEMFEISSNESGFNTDDHPNDEEVNNENVVVPQALNEEMITRIYNIRIPPSLIREDGIWDKIRKPLSPNLIEHGNSICCENTINMINSINDLREENRNMLSSINEAINLMLAVTTNMSRVIEDIYEKLESKDSLDK
ncbi:hypothetical protein Tco_0008698 [Tanacetum coccineum]